MSPSTRGRERSARTAALASRVTLHLAEVPVEGIVHEPYVWPDVLGADAPLHDGPGAYCVPGPEIPSEAHRIEHALLVREGIAGDIELEFRVGIVDRVLAATITRERAVFAGVPVLRSVTRGLATFPDKLRSRASKAMELLATPTGRARFARGLADPHALTSEQKALTLFVGTLVLILAILVVHALVTLAAPGFASVWRSAVLLFGYGYVSSLGLPLPWEPVLIGAALLIGAIPAIVVGVLAKLVAGYMVFFLGDAVNEKLERRARKHAWFARFVAWSEEFARRWGILAMAVFIATPGLPDAIALYVFGALRMPLRKYLIGIALGALVLDAAAVYGVAHLLHLG